MAKLTQKEWTSLRAEWETGAFSNRALGLKWGVDEAAIRQRARNANQEGGAWARDGSAMEKIHERATIRTIRDQSAEGAELRNANEVRADPVTREAIREQIIEEAATVLAEQTSQHLKRLEKAKTLADRWAGLLDTFLAPLPAGDPETSPALKAAISERTEAAERLLAGRTDTIGGGLQALMRMLESIQKQTRVALGAEDRPKKVELTGANGGPMQTENAHDVGVDLAAMPTEKLALLYQAIQVLEGETARPPIPVPPGGEEEASTEGAEG